MFKYARNVNGSLVRDFAGNLFVFRMTEDIDGFMRQILGLEFDEYTVHYMIVKMGSTIEKCAEEMAIAS